MTLVLIDAALKVALLAVAGLAAAALLRRQAAALRHRVLACALVCMAVMPMLAAVVPAWRVPVHATLEVSDRRPVEAGTPPLGPAGLVAQVEGRAAPAPPSAEHTSHASPRDATLLGAAAALVLPVWIAGVAAVILTLVAGLARLGWLAARSTRLESGPWVEFAEALSRRYALRRPVLLLRSPHPTLLVTWGHRRPKVMLPVVAKSWERERIEVVLAHELCHVRRGDWAAQMAAHLVRALHWFNPLVWIACRRLAREAEHACDDEVLNSGIEGSTYAGHLLELARAFNGPRRTWWPAPAIVRSCSLERRVRAMLTPGTNRRPVPRVLSAAAVLALLCLALPLAGLQVFAQSFSTLSGVVLDPHGRPVPDVTVVLSNEASRSKYEVMSNDAGRFELAGLQPGDYVLGAKRFGFTPFEERLAVTGGDLHRQIAMQLGTLQETIVIAGESTGSGRRNRTDMKNADEARSHLQRAEETCMSSSDAAAAGGNLQPPIKVKHVGPVYPAHLRTEGVGGVVKLNARVASDGQVTEIEPISNEIHPELIAAASEAVGQWQFEPTLLNCVPVEVSMKVAIEFRPPQE